MAAPKFPIVFELIFLLVSSEPLLISITVFIVFAELALMLIFESLVLANSRVASGSREELPWKRLGNFRMASLTSGFWHQTDCNFLNLPFTHVPTLFQ